MLSKQEWSLPLIPQAKVVDVPEKPQLPTFKRRWWFKPNRLDARPVIWSLNNHPEEWVRGRSRDANGPYAIIHTPSKHEFWVANGRTSVRLYRAPQAGGTDCSCSSNRGRFQPFQKGAFWRAYKTWAAKNPEPFDEGFAEHFVHE